MDSSTILCPSSKCEEGAVLLGVILENGSVAFAAERIEVDREFVMSAQEGRSPEKRFRFSSPCAQCGCKQWVGGQCSVIGKVLSTAPESLITSELPMCSIRTQCRWFHQTGSKACSICPLVITDLREEAESVTP
jgi:hypothetical protein